MVPMWRWPATIRQLARLFRQSGVDGVVLHGQWAGPIGALAAKLAGVKHSIYIAHCPAFYHSTTLFRVIRNYIAEIIPCRSCQRVVTLSEGNYYNYLFRGWAPESHLVRIANGFDTTTALPDREAFRQQNGFDPNTRHCVFVGRLDDQKRPDWLIEAWAGAQSLRHPSTPPWLLWIVGDGTERSSSEALARELGVAGSVKFAGYQPEGLPWINAADLVVMSSLYEGHALVPLEAMACSRAIVAFAADGVTDSVVHGKTGLLCEIGDTQALGLSIARLLQSDVERETFGRNGRQLVHEQFPLSKTVARYRTLLGQLFAQS